MNTFYVDEKKRKRLIKRIKKDKHLFLFDLIKMASIIFIGICAVMYFCKITKMMMVSVKAGYTEDIMFCCLCFVAWFCVLLIASLVPAYIQRFTEHKFLYLYTGKKFESFSIDEKKIVWAYWEYRGRFGSISKRPYYEYIFKKEDILKIEYDEKQSAYRIYGNPRLEEWHDVNKSYHADTTMPAEFEKMPHSELFPAITVANYFFDEEMIKRLLIEKYGNCYEEKIRDFDEYEKLYRKLEREKK